MKKPEKAIRQLEKSLSFVEGQTPAQAEPFRNMVRAYDQLNNREQALHYWKLACPLLTANYGEEHERVRYATQRILELEKER